MSEPNLDRLVDELNAATEAEAKPNFSARPFPKAVVPVDEATKADRLITLAKGSYDTVAKELATKQREYEITKLNIEHDARDQIDRIMGSTNAKLSNLALEHERGVRQMKDLLELYAKIKF